MIEKILTIAAGGYVLHKSINFALLRFAFKGEYQRVPLAKQLLNLKGSLSDSKVVKVRKMTSEDGERQFYYLALEQNRDNLQGKSFYMQHKKHSTHINTLCGSLILGTLIGNTLDRELLVEELL